jgi:HD-GYP domain-containing protein (c-di-GMP phosphodiesterase class II)
VSERIRDAQQRLGRTLRRARLVEDRALARTVRELGERLAHINYGLLQLVRIHDVSNEAFDKPVEEFRHALKCLIDLLGPVNLVCVEDQVWVNDIRVRFDIHHEHAQALERMLRRHNVGGLTYFRELTAKEVRTVLRLFASDPAARRPRTTLQRQLDHAGLSSIELKPTFQFTSDVERVQRTVTEVYQASAEVLAEVFANLESHRLPNPLPVRRVVNDVIDATYGKDLARIALEIDTTSPEFARHPLMVANLSLLIGHAAGLPDRSLADLMVAAMLHDAGFYCIGGDHLEAFSRHTTGAVREMLRQRGFHEARIRRLLVFLEHHQPHRQTDGPPSLHARIIHIADDYDALTRHHNGEDPAHVPADAIRMMAAAAGDGYDPVLLQLFINAVGAYPPGSVLRIADGTLVVPISGVRSPETFALPRCKVVRMADGTEPDQDLWVDLAKGGRVVEVLGSRLVTFQVEPEPDLKPPPKPAPPPPRPTFGNPHLTAPKPPKATSNNGD